MRRTTLPSALETVAEPLMMWQYSAALLRSAVKRPGVHSQTPIEVRPSGEVHSLALASRWPSVSGDGYIVIGSIGVVGTLGNHWASVKGLLLC